MTETVIQKEIMQQQNNAVTFVNKFLKKDSFLHLRKNMRPCLTN